MAQANGMLALSECRYGSHIWPFALGKQQMQL
jgi:hypothetical protein